MVDWHCRSCRIEGNITQDQPGRFQLTTLGACTRAGTGEAALHPCTRTLVLSSLFL